MKYNIICGNSLMLILKGHNLSVSDKKMCTSTGLPFGGFILPRKNVVR